ncbi:hypothetical protein AAMO2058_000302100 [Amorphochlora amoebiformis]|uniref:Uncharacterized protein n=1 Tax=Amorphochlora amoebiformis TaxID=1561963 RepID=A0A7S0DS91_9EUKA|mmetsp:Transcript_7022/g.10870  ORF Transcript_7022/g.10870 Transcript_7022/m.10870 type:complete len:117 (+) Transcript_7022:97-447(+)
MDDSDIAAAMEAIGGTNETLGAIDGAHEIGCLCCNTALEEMTGGMYGMKFSKYGRLSKLSTAISSGLKTVSSLDKKEEKKPQGGSTEPDSQSKEPRLTDNAGTQKEKGDGRDMKSR